MVQLLWRRKCFVSVQGGVEREEAYLSVLGLDCCLAGVGVMGLTLKWTVVRASRKRSEPV